MSYEIKKINKRSLIRGASYVSIFSLIAFQNCSDVNLHRQISQQVVGSTSLADASFCTKPTGIGTGITKILFVIDMSFSNIGAPLSPTPPYYNSSVATDLTEQRFNAITSFMNNCGSGPQNQYAVAAFSGKALRQYQAPGYPAAGGCPSGFTTTAGAQAQLQTWINAQQNTIAQASAYAGGNFSALMGETDYMDGFNCASNIVTADINANAAQAQNTAYFVFFLTDGAPSDNCGVSQANATTGICNNAGQPPVQENGSFLLNPGYQSTLFTLANFAKAKASDYKFQTVYYGNASDSLWANAQPVLDEITQIGESQATVQVANVGALNFCSLAQSPIKTQYRQTGFNVINLTAVLQKEVLLADSDMDGVPDNIDPNPTNARSMSNVLDGICMAAGGNPATCGQNATPACQLNKVNGMHLTDCDAAALGLTDGYDTDLDTIPDFIEIIRGTDPIRSDALDNLDGDSLNNISEIAVGRQVNWPDDDVPANLLVNVSFNPLPAGPACPANQQFFHFKINQVPLIHTLAYTDPNDCSASGLNPAGQPCTLPSSFLLSHGADENVLLIYYTIQPVNDPTLPDEIWGKTVNIPYGVTAPDITIEPTDFQKLGAINGSQL